MSESVQSALERLAEGNLPVVVHPLGFACLRIADGLCVHAWLPGEPELEPDGEMWSIHCHRWNLDSRVLAGSVANVVWDVRGSSKVYATGRVYGIRVTPDSDVIRPGALATAARSDSTFIGAGGSYTMPAGVFHESEVAEPTVTLLTAVYVPGARDRALGPLIPPANRVTRRRTASPALAVQVTDLAIRSLKEFA